MSRLNAALPPGVLLLLFLAAPAASSRRFGRDTQGRAPNPGHAFMQTDALGLAQDTLEVQRANFTRISDSDYKPPKGFKMGTSHGKGDHIANAKMMPCGHTAHVTSSSTKGKVCPKECPYIAQDKADDDYCTFRCVPDAQTCLKYNPRTPIADEEMGICRAPKVQSCKEYNVDGSDTCKECDFLYVLAKDGTCHHQFMTGIYCFAGFLLIVFCFVLVWVCDLSCRPRTNQEALNLALEARSREKPRRSKEFNRDLWPLNTNLHKETPGGPGMLLHFNFQMAVIVWGFFVAIAWMVTAHLVDPSLWILGTRRFGTPRDNCILVAWGYEKQHAFFWAKVAFMSVVYAFTLLGSLWFGAYQLKKYRQCDKDNKTMNDYVAIIEGVPKIKGTERLEETLKGSVEELTGKSVVGVTVAWDYREDVDLVNEFLDKEMLSRQAKLHPSTPQAEDAESPSPGFIRGGLLAMEKSIFGTEPEEEEEGTASMQDTMKTKLEEMESSNFAFAVFDSEADRDAAVAKTNSGGEWKYEGNPLTLKTFESEPDTVLWENVGERDLVGKSKRFFQGCCCIGLALVFWTVVFYAPYAYSIFTFNYDNGQEPGPAYSIAFSMVVVVGNLVMYETCDRVANHIGFTSKDAKQVCYMILFTTACLYNIMVDMVTTYFTAEQIALELGFRTYQGEKLVELEHFTDRFETYAMQRVMAESLYLYAFPSTYLIPFILEPIFTIYVPLVLGIAIVGSHPEMDSRSAAEWLACIDMDLGRYADLILNMVLGVGIFYFPGGYTHWLFMGLAFSHIYVYFLDRYRLLRTVPSITLASMDVDWWSQLLVAPCCGLIASCIVFKANCAGFGFCISGMTLILSCSAAWLVHTVLHLALLVYVVPKMVGNPKDEDSEDATEDEAKFKEVASVIPISWFSCNPIHCLRSQLIYDHKPPCLPFKKGMEHLLEVNAEIGCYFTDQEPQGEKFTVLTKAVHEIRPTHIAEDVKETAREAATHAKEIHRQMSRSAETGLAATKEAAQKVQEATKEAAKKAKEKMSPSRPQ